MPAKRSIATDAIKPLMRARARGLSLTSTMCALPDSRIVRAASSSARLSPPSGGSSWIETTNSLRAEQLLQLGLMLFVAVDDRQASLVDVSGRDGGRFASIAPRIAAISAGVVPQQPPITPAPRLRACAANSAKYSGVACG